MGTFSKIVLSGSSDGKPLAVSGTAPTLGVVVHTGITGNTDAFDEVWVYAFNNATTDRDVTLHWGASGGSAAAGDDAAIGANQVFTVPARDGDYLLCPGHIMRGQNTLLAFDTANPNATGGVAVNGWVNRFASAA